MESKYEDYAGCFGCLTFLLVGSLFLFPGTIFDWIRTNFWMQSLLCLGISALLLRFGYLAGMEANPRIRVLCIVSVFGSSVFFFGWIYSSINYFWPGSFRMDESLIAEEKRNKLDDFAKEYSQFALQRYIVASLQGITEAQVVRLIPKKEIDDKYRTETSASATESISPYESMRLVRSIYTPPFNKNSELNGQTETYTLEVTTKRHSGSSAFEGAFGTDSNFIKELYNAQSPLDFRETVDDEQKEIDHKMEKSQVSFRRLALGEPYFDMTRFIYFSTAVMTTVGSGDISPASSPTRLVVILESGFAVFLLGYAVQLLWPHDKNHDG